jgi:TonB family protein
VLIGSAPTARYPDELRAQRIEGEVVVQFRVNEKGRVDASSMQVMQSPHPLFSDAVRSVLPKFRFEPAHAGAGGSKPQAAWVQFHTRFTAQQQ